MSSKNVAVILFTVSMVITLAAALGALSAWTFPAVLIGWFLADAASGLTHMIMDYRPCPAGKGLAELYFYKGHRESPDYLRLRDEAMAKLSPLDRLTYDFKNHHPRPDALGRRSLWRQIGSTVIAGALPASILLNFAWWLADLPGFVMAGGFAFLIGAAFAQYFHGTLHRDDNPGVIRAMRATGLLMTPSAHQKHHDTLQRDFSTNCGWSNVILNVIFRTARNRGYLQDHGLEPGH